jgi:hypothetical protein
MTLQDLLGAQRTVYVLAEKPGMTDVNATQFWYLKLGGLHQEQLKASVAQLRKEKLKSAKTKLEERSLKTTGVLNVLARALGAKSYDDWLEREQPKICDLLNQHGMSQPANLIKWAHPPDLVGALKARQVSDRIFNSGLPMPQKIFTGVGSHLFSPSGYGRLDIDEIAGRYGEDAERYEFCSERSDEVLLRAEHMRDANGPACIDMTGRTLMLNAVSEYVGCFYNMLSDNLAMPLSSQPEPTLYKANEEELAFQLKIFDLFREEIERSEAGWVDVIKVPGNENLVFLKGANGTFDWVVRDQRDAGLTSNPLYPFFDKDELPTALDTSQIMAHLYFTRGDWQETLEHDAEKRHYAEGGTTGNWPGYDKLIERELMASHRVVAPKRVSGHASNRFFSHRVGNHRLMVSSLITIDQFSSFLEETDWHRTRLEKAHKAKLALERDLLSVNAGDSGDLPVSVTWLDAVAYCSDYEKRHGLPVRLLEPEEWQQIAPPPSVDRSRVQSVRSITSKGDEWPIDPIYEQLNWAVVGGDGGLGKNSTHCERPDGVLSFGPNLNWTKNSEGLSFLSVAGFAEWLAGYQRGFAPFAEAGRGIVATGAGIFGSLKPAHLAMRDEGAKVGFRLCYVAHPDA